MFFIIDFFKSVVIVAAFLWTLSATGILPKLTLYMAKNAADLHKSGFMSLEKFNRKLSGK